MNRPIPLWAGRRRHDVDRRRRTAIRRKDECWPRTLPPGELHVHALHVASRILLLDM